MMWMTMCVLTLIGCKRGTVEKGNIDGLTALAHLVLDTALGCKKKGKKQTKKAEAGEQTVPDATAEKC
jgi:hypothetical protein